MVVSGGVFPGCTHGGGLGGSLPGVYVSWWWSRTESSRGVRMVVVLDWLSDSRGVRMVVVSISDSRGVRLVVVSDWVFPGFTYGGGLGLNLGFLGCTHHGVGLGLSLGLPGRTYGGGLGLSLGLPDSERQEDGLATCHTTGKNKIEQESHQSSSGAKQCAQDRRFGGSQLDSDRISDLQQEGLATCRTTSKNKIEQESQFPKRRQNIKFGVTVQSN